LIFVILFPKSKAPHPEHTGGDAHNTGGYRIMGAVLLILTAVTLTLGFLQAPLEGFFAEDPAFGPIGHHTGTLIAALVLVAAAVGLAWLEFGRKGARQVGFVERLPALSSFFAQRWYLDHLYRLLLDRVVYRGFSAFCTAGDRRAIDGFIHGVSHETVRSGGRLSLLHGAMIQYRLLLLFAVMVLLGGYLLYWHL
jgi:NADH-quinone oxidoreductase subunit L